MINELHSNLAKKEWFDELQSSEWFTLSKLYYKCDQSQCGLFTNILASHTGIPIIQITNALFNLGSETASTTEQEHILNELLHSQHNATLKIAEFQQRKYIKQIDLQPLSISRAQWLGVIERFEQEKRQNLTRVYFISTLSSIKKISYEVLISGLTRHEQTKRSVHKTEQEPDLKPIIFQHRYNPDDEINPLVMEQDAYKPDLSRKLKATGVRQTQITHATPDKRYPLIVKTPGGTKVRPLCTIGAITFFKPTSPMSKEPLQGRVDVRKSQKHTHLQIKQAASVQFTATLPAIIERASKIRRQSQFAQTKIKSSDVFRAHGIEIKPEHGRNHHWAHLIAHFLGDINDVSTLNPEKEVINLVPSTAAANYNTLETVELFIREKLIKKETQKIDILVIPQYSKDALIPDMLEYRLAWTEENAHGQTQQCNELFYINPQSYQRITHKMQQSIAVLRAHRDQRASSSHEKYNENDDNYNNNDFKP